MPVQAPAGTPLENVSAVTNQAPTATPSENGSAAPDQAIPAGSDPAIPSTGSMPQTDSQKQKGEASSAVQEESAQHPSDAAVVSAARMNGGSLGHEPGNLHITFQILHPELQTLSKP